jgi:hypothetical protein
VPHSQNLTSNRGCRRALVTAALVALLATACACSPATEGASPGGQATGNVDRVPDPSAELRDYAGCLREHRAPSEFTGGLIMLAEPVTQSQLDAARRACADERDAFAATIESKGEGQDPKNPAQADFGAMLTGCLQAQDPKGKKWLAERTDPVLLSGDPRAKQARICVEHNMDLPKKFYADPSKA